MHPGTGTPSGSCQCLVSLTVARNASTVSISPGDGLSPAVAFSSTTFWVGKCAFRTGTVPLESTLPSLATRSSA